MTEDKVKTTHLRRSACVYVRQSTISQVERNRESTDRQYQLVKRALRLGWSKEQVQVVDEDLGQSGVSTTNRSGFTKLTTDIALGLIGIVLSIEVSRLARNNSDWYRLLDLCGVTDTLIADTDGIYHPGLFNDRLVLGLKGTMSEAELHVIRARLEGGIRNKAARGELRRGLPVGFVWGDADGEVRFHPDEAVTSAIRSVFDRFVEFGSVRRVWLWFRSQNLSFPAQLNSPSDVHWVTPSYHAICCILHNPVYAGAYVYGKTRLERTVDEQGNIKKRIRHLPRHEWAVFIPDHHEGFIDWETYETIQARIAKNTRPRPHQAGGAVREGAALLQGLATCGNCGRKLKVYYQGKNASPGYHCPGNTIVNGRGMYCLRVGGCRIDQAVSEAFLHAVAPAGTDAALRAEEDIEAERDAALAQWRLEVERVGYEAQRAERRYRSVDPENRLVARGLEKEWEQKLQDLASAETELKSREQRCLRRLTNEQRLTIRALGCDLQLAWEAPTTTDRDRKELLHTLLEEIIINVDRENSKAHLTLRWRGGLFSEIEVDLWRVRVPPIRTDEDTIELVRRLAAHYSDAIIAGILNRQGRRTATGERFTANRVGGLRRYWKISKFVPPQTPPEGELVNIREAAARLGVVPSTVHRWLADGFIAGEQITPGAPWRIRITDEFLARFVEELPEGYVPMQEATKLLGVTRQTVLQRVKRGELSYVHVRRGKQNTIRIKVVDNQHDLFDRIS
jgi:DNA invertase Pin-like site-specific DNA recombinase